METNLVQMTKDRHCSCRQTLVLTYCKIPLDIYFRSQ